MDVPRTATEIRDINTRYHDAAAADYDSKWGIDFGGVGRQQVVTKLRKALGERPAPFERSLEIGAGTGYFTLNLLQAGFVRRAVCSDISPGMLEVLQGNARRLGLEVATVRGEAEQLPLADASFDLVFGHAVLHHLPDLPRAFSEFHRVLAPGGMLVFAGEPSRYGDRLAQVPKRGAAVVAPLWRRALRAPHAPPAGEATSAGNGDVGGGDYGMEFAVDVHSFAPGELRAFASNADFEAIRVSGEELLASWFGWANRTLESTTSVSDLPRLWIQYAHRGYLALQQLDRRLLEGRLPPEVFYNLMLAARKPQ
jgi:SAM-dependent methyltransferase